MNKEDKKEFEQKFKEYCKFVSENNKSRFKAIFNSWDESKNFLSVAFTCDADCNELEYFKSLGWTLISTYKEKFLLMFEYTTYIFRKND